MDEIYVCSNGWVQSSLVFSISIPHVIQHTSLCAITSHKTKNIQAFSFSKQPHLLIYKSLPSCVDNAWDIQESSFAYGEEGHTVDDQISEVPPCASSHLWFWLWHADQAKNKNSG